MTGTSVMKNLLILAKWQLITVADILTNFTEIPFNDFIIFLLPLGLRMTDRTCFAHDRSNLFYESKTRSFIALKKLPVKELQIK